MAKTVLITGASSGIGEDAVKGLLAAGHIVYAAARRVDRMQPLADAGARVFSLDVTDDEAMTIAVKTILQEAGHIDVLINNAGYGSYGALEDVPLDEARRQFDVNIFGLARLIQLVLPSMREHRSGRIVNVSSIGGEFGEPFGSWYHATKFALEGLSDSLRMELHPFGIDVVVIQPGAILTEWNSIARDGTQPVGAPSQSYSCDASYLTVILTRSCGWRNARRQSPPRRGLSRSRSVGDGELFFARSAENSRADLRNDGV